jgi:archaellum component FlaG (FlaF/FlaG flagellin family)
LAKWITTGAVVFICVIISTAYWVGKLSERQANELANAKADQAQADEAREIKNAVEKLDDTGLRDAFDKLRSKRPSH